MIFRLQILLLTLLTSTIDLLAQVPQAVNDTTEYSFDIFNYNWFEDDDYDWQEGHTLIKAKGDAISMVDAEIIVYDGIKSYEDVIETLLIGGDFDTLALQLHALQENGDPYTFYYTDMAEPDSIDHITGEVYGFKIIEKAYSNEKLLEWSISGIEALKYFYNANIPTIIVRFPDKDYYHDQEEIKEDIKHIEEEIKHYKVETKARIGEWTVYFDNGQLAAKGNYIPFVFYEYERLTYTDEYDNEVAQITIEETYFKDGIWQTYKPNGELFRILNYNKGELKEGFELINGKLEKIIEPNNDLD
jgi:hypothetical protein